MRIINTLLIIAVSMVIIGLLGQAMASCFYDHDSGVIASALVGVGCGSALAMIIIIRHLS
jgi:hypothetical protein